jgi:hypothetical protein
LSQSIGAASADGCGLALTFETDFAIEHDENVVFMVVAVKRWAESPVLHLSK